MSFTSDGRFNLPDLPYYLDSRAGDCRSLADRLGDAVSRMSLLDSDEDPRPYIEMLMWESAEALKLLKELDKEFFAIRNAMALQEAMKKLEVFA